MASVPGPRLGLAAAWRLEMLDASAPRRAVFHVGMAFDWWFTQAKVIFLYLKLMVWPWPLVVHYEMPYLNTLARSVALGVGSRVATDRCGGSRDSRRGVGICR